MELILKEASKNFPFWKRWKESSKLSKDLISGDDAEIADSSSSFIMKSLVDDLVSSIEPPARDLYSAILLDHCPKKIKKFLSELGLGAINTGSSPVSYALYVYLSSWCIMCQKHVETPTHLFVHCSFASCFWHIIMDGFGCPSPTLLIFFMALHFLRWVTHLWAQRRRFGWLFSSCLQGVMGQA